MPKKPPANRTLCKICNIWIADNKIQRLQHEEASKHKQKRAALLKSIAEKNEQKAKEERKAAAIAAGQVTTGAGRATAATAMRQLLEKAAGGFSQELESEKSRKRPREASKESPGFVEPVESGDTHVREEGVDENEFPLPAPALYGQWQPVEADEKEEKDGSRHLYWQDDDEQISENKNEAKDDLRNQEQEDPVAEECVSDAVKDTSNGQKSNISASLKRRPARRTKRVRRRTSTL